MHNISSNIAPSSPLPASVGIPKAAAADDDKGKLVPASFAQIYRATVAAAVDTNGDQVISADEYRTQISAAGGGSGQAALQFQQLDTNADGSVSVGELAGAIHDPLGDDYSAVIQQVIQEIQRGLGTAPPAGDVLNAQGQVRDSHQVMRYVAANFPGNIGY